MTDRNKVDILTPEFRISINGSELPLKAKADLTSVCVQEDVGAAGMFAFTLGCWDGAEMKVKWIDDNLFKEGNEVEIEMGYRDAMKKVFQGEITSLEPDFPGGDAPVLTVSGYDRRHRLMGKHKTRTFLKMKDSAIASQIASDYGLQPDTTDSQVTHDYVLQNNQTDFLFLQERAQRIGYEVVVDGRTLRFRPRPTDKSAVLTLKREVELLEFSARLSTVCQVQKLTVQGWDPKNKQVWTAQAGAGDVKSMNGSASGPSAVGSAFGSTGGIGVQAPIQSQSEADQIAKGRLKETALAYVEGQGVCIGDPDLRAGTVVKIEGLGTRFSGPYYVISTDHSYRSSSGYRTSFMVRRNAT